MSSTEGTGWQLDLQDAYLTVPIFYSRRRFLRFQWRAQAYQFRCLPFGLATGPRVFTKLMRPVVTCLRQQGIRLVQYLDDTLLVAESPEALKAHLRKAANLLEELGFLLNKRKCVWTPTQRIEFLGFEVDSNTMHLDLPPKKVEKISKECKSVRARGHLTVRRLAHLIGLLTSTIPAVLPLPSTAVPQGESIKKQSSLLQHCNSSGQGCPCPEELPTVCRPSTGGRRQGMLMLVEGTMLGSSIEGSLSLLSRPSPP